MSLELARMPLSPRLSCAEVSVHFGGIAALEDVTLEVPGGAVVGLVGPNGAGKSTLFGVLCGLIDPSRGRVLLEGEDVTSRRPQHRARLGLARTFQHPELFLGLTVRQHLVLAHRAKHASSRVWSDLFTVGSLRPPDPAETAAVNELLELLGLTPDAHRPASSLPLGAARLLELGRALASSPTVLLLDEPSSGLDAADTARFEEILGRVARERDLSVLLVEHDVELVMRMCQSVYVLDFGEMIASGTPTEVRANPAVRAAYLGEERVEEKPSPVTPVVAGAVPAEGAMHEPAPETSAPPPILVVDDLRVSYGDAVALSGVSFTLPRGPGLAVLGANGAGKTTLARALAGLVPLEGKVMVDGRDVTGIPAHRLRRAGVVLLPEGRGVFRSLTVTENLRMATALQPRAQRRAAEARALDMFPQLGRRLRQPAGRLSGGEQQMLSLARALATSPTLIVADELSLGLAPLLVDVVFEGLEQIKKAGVTVIMIEQYIHRALAFAEECLVLERGQVAWRGPSSLAEGEVLRHYLGEGAMAV
jgi:ABC-type branched-subunit amino acid transport system ATPase component